MHSYSELLLSRPTVLCKSLWILDDEEVDRLILETVFKKISKDLNIQTWSNPCDFLQHYLQKKAPDVLLIDLHLPRMHGFELIQRIHQEWLTSVRVYFITSSIHPLDWEHKPSYPILGKPISHNILQSIVSQQLIESALSFKKAI